MDFEATDPPKPAVSPSDGDLVRQAQGTKGDKGQAAYDQLIRRYQRQAVAVSYRLLGNLQDALEVTQDAFLKGFTSIASLQNPDAFGGWLMRIVSNLSLNYRRSRKSRPALPLDDLLSRGEESAGSDWAAQDAGPLHGIESREMGQKLKSALQRLPEKQRMALILFTIEERPQKEIAVTLGCSVDAVKWHVFQGRKKLKEMLKDYL